jgi:outer membrane translocation and assembly module TamA
VEDIKSRLEKGELFKQVTIASADMDKSGKKVRFKLKIDL